MKTDARDVNWGVPRLLSYLTTLSTSCIYKQQSSIRETHGEIICPGALACISNIVTDWFKSRNKMFSVFPIVFINNDKPIELTATVLFYWENVTVVNLPNSGWHFLLCDSLGEDSPDTVGIKGITSECRPVQIAVGKKVKLQRSPGKLIFPNCISWQETQILEVPVEIIQYLNSD